ncbi:MAG: sulfatase [Verrucomicrobia bacterium]|nr:sulfatase [Verrucomicrobiota bacterium]
MKPTSRNLLLACLAMACACFHPASAANAPAKRPNVIVFLVDDMGWMDCGAYGSKYYETPNMDRFAARAMRFTDAYAQPLCSPTRASLLTGKYSARHGITSATGHQPPQPAGHKFLPDTAPPNQPMLVPQSKNFMEPSEYTLAEALRDAGYRTAHIGKWHLGLTQPHWPEQQGFDVAFHCHPDPGPPGGYFSPYDVKPDGEPHGNKSRVGTITDGPPGEYIVDRLAAEAVKFIEANRNRPFFLNLWNYGVHGPWGHKPEYTKLFASKKDPRGVQGNPIMASMLRSVDECFGRILDALEKNGLAENTIIVFNSDNGGNTHSNTGEDGKAKKRKADDPFVTDWRKWAGNQPPTVNTPLRDGKGTLYEGGTRVPLMWAWPGRIKVGTTSDAVVGHIDLYPTLLDLIGLPRPAQQKMDGVSYACVLKQTGPLERKAFFNYFPHGRSVGRCGGVWVRSGDWKLIRWFGAPPSHELYNLRDDISEAKDLAAAQPARVKDLDALIDGFLADTGATYPRPNPAYKPSERPAVARRAQDPLGGWVDKTNSAKIEGGILKLQLAGGNAFIATTALKHAGEAVFQFRARSAAGGPGKMWWRAADQEQFDPKNVVGFDLPGDNEWHEVRIALPVKGTLQHVRLYPASKAGAVEIDWIRLCDQANKTKKEWQFGR